MILIDSWKAWFLAGCIVIFDILLFMAMVNQPVPAARDRTMWDFRISELRQLEGKDGRYLPPVASHHSTTNSELALAPYFPGLERSEEFDAWWLATGEPALDRGQTYPGDAAGKVL